MATPRRPLGPIDGNTVRGKELSRYERGKIVRARIAGMSPREIELQMKRSRGAVRSALCLEILRTNGASMPRNGRPRIYNERDCRTMLRNLHVFWKNSF